MAEQVVDEVPSLTNAEREYFLDKAAISPRRRFPKILHQPGDELNRVVNFMKMDTYMIPHLHPGVEKIEHIHLLSGKFAVFFFNDDGAVDDIKIVSEQDRIKVIKVPAFRWHTYLMLSESVVSYETMMGRYYPQTWKSNAVWAPSEDSSESRDYLKYLRDKHQIFEKSGRL